VRNVDTHLRGHLSFPIFTIKQIHIPSLVPVLCKTNLFIFHITISNIKKGSDFLLFYIKLYLVLRQEGR